MGTKLSIPRRAPARVGRSALTWGMATFLVLQLGIAVGIETALPSWRDPIFGVKIRLLTQRTIAAPTRVPTVVMVGSSRVENGLLAQALETQLATASGQPMVAFNFGLSGAGPVTEQLVVRRMLAAGIRPDLLVIEVLSPTLAGQIMPSEIGRLPADRLYLHELPVVARYGADLTDLRSEWWQGLVVPAFSHRYAILACTLPQFLPGRVPFDSLRRIDSWGVGELPGKPTPEGYEHNVKLMLANYRPSLTDFRLGGPACEGLRDLLELCRREHVRPMLVLMPEGRPFRALYSADTWAQIETFLTGLSREFDAPLVNAREWVPDEYFTDSHHLLPGGAARFTQRLGRDHIAPLLTGTRTAGR
jgi:hypothetical protein